MTTSPIAKKLGIKTGMNALVVAPPPGYLEKLAPLPDNVQVTQSIGGLHHFVQLFAFRKAEIQKTAPLLLKHAAPGALVWITYPKKTSGVESDLSREQVWEAMSGTGWRPVSQIAIDEVWSCFGSVPSKTSSHGSASCNRAMTQCGLRSYSPHPRYVERT